MSKDFLHEPCLWVVGYPRSGNTWINYLCAYCLNLPFHDFDALAHRPQKDWVRAAVAGRHEWRAAEGFAAVVKTHKLPAKVPHVSGRVIYLQRDPRDVFVSQHHSSFSAVSGAARAKKILVPVSRTVRKARAIALVRAALAATCAGLEAIRAQRDPIREPAARGRGLFRAASAASRL
jgi:hypothetical protein